jgi:hypothetical protein
MKYFEGITDLKNAKLRYRTLAKQLHPDKGGTAIEFQKMKEEYKTLLLQLHKNHNAVINPKQSQENELLNELSKLAKVLIKKQVPQYYLKQRITKSQSPIEQKFCSGIVSILDRLSE